MTTPPSIILYLFPPLAPGSVGLEAGYIHITGTGCNPGYINATQEGAFAPDVPGYPGGLCVNTTNASVHAIPVNGIVPSITWQNVLPNAVYSSWRVEYVGEGIYTDVFSLWLSQNFNLTTSFGVPITNAADPIGTLNTEAISVYMSNFCKQNFKGTCANDPLTGKPAAYCSNYAAPTTSAQCKAWAKTPVASDTIKKEYCQDHGWGTTEQAPECKCISRNSDPDFVLLGGITSGQGAIALPSCAYTYCSAENPDADYYLKLSELVQCNDQHVCENIANLYAKNASKISAGTVSQISGCKITAVNPKSSTPSTTPSTTSPSTTTPTNSSTTPSNTTPKTPAVPKKPVTPSTFVGSTGFWIMIAVAVLILIIFVALAGRKSEPKWNDLRGSSMGRDFRDRGSWGGTSIAKNEKPRSTRQAPKMNFVTGSNPVIY